MILVTGATGNVGSEVVRELGARGALVRALVRDPDRARDQLGSEVELVVGDFSQPRSVRRAMDGVRSVFLSSADGPDKVVHETTVIDAAAGAGLQLIVKQSTIGAEIGSPVPFWDAHGRIERVLHSSSVPAVILRSGFSMANLLASAPAVAAGGQLFAPAGNARIAMIDPRDVGATAAAVLSEDQQGSRTYTLTGPEAISYEQVAACLSEATGRPVEFVDIPAEAARGAALEAGMPSWLADGLVAVFAALKAGAAEQVTDTVQALTGRPARTFADFARDRATLFGASTTAASRA